MVDHESSQRTDGSRSSRSKHFSASSKSSNTAVPFKRILEHRSSISVIADTSHRRRSAVIHTLFASLPVKLRNFNQLVELVKFAEFLACVTKLVRWGRRNSFNEAITLVSSLSDRSVNSREQSRTRFRLYKKVLADHIDINSAN